MFSGMFHKNDVDILLILLAVILNVIAYREIGVFVWIAESFAFEGPGGWIYAYQNLLAGIAVLAGGILVFASVRQKGRESGPKRILPYFQ